MITAVHYIPVWIAPHVVLVVSIGWTMTAIAEIVQRIYAVTKIFHKIALAGCRKWSPADEIHIQSYTGETDLLDIDEQIPWITDLHIIPSGVRGAA